MQADHALTWDPQLVPGLGLGLLSLTVMSCPKHNVNPHIAWRDCSNFSKETLSNSPVQASHDGHFFVLPKAHAGCKLSVDAKQLICV